MIVAKRVKFYLILFSIQAIFFSNVCSANEAVFRKQLENGLTVLARTSPPRDLVTINISIKAALLHENEYLGSGISHLIEHMVFKGTSNRRPGEIEKEVRSYGGVIDGSVSSDATVYQLTVPTNYFPNALSLLKDMLLNAAFDQAELEKEREVILKEIKMNNDDPEKRTILSLFSNAYIRHPYKYPAIGFENLLKDLTRADLVKYYNMRYVPNNIVISIVGGISEQDAVSAVEKEFKNFRSPDYKPLNNGEREPAQTGKRVVIDRMETTLSYLALGYHSTSINDKDMFAADVLSMILGRGEGSRLNKILVRDKRKAYTVSASNYTPQDPGLFIITAILDENNIEDAEKIILEEIEKIKEGDILDEDLQRAKRTVLSDYILSREAIEDQARDSGENELITGNYDFSSRYVEGVKKVSKSELRRAAMRYLDEGNLTEIRLEPEKNTPLPGLSVPKELIEDKIEKTVLPNGLTVLTRKSSKIPAVSITIAFSGGLSVEDENNSGISNFVAGMLLSGTEKRKEPDIKDAIENLGGEIVPFSGFNSFGVNINILKDDVDTALDIIGDIVTDSVFPQELIERDKLLVLGRIKDEDDNIFQKGALFLRKSLFKNHPYAMRYTGEVGTVASFKRNDLIGFYRAFCVPNNTIISISGDIDKQKTIKKIESLFKNTERKEIPKAVLNTATIDKIDRKNFSMDREQSLLMVGFKTVSITNPDRYPLDLLNTIMSGMSGTLFASLRDKHGLAYTLGCSQKLGLDTGFMLFYVATTKEKLDAAEKSLFEQIRLIRDKLLTDEDVASARRELISNYKMFMQTNTAHSFQSALDELYGIGYDNLYKYEDEIKKVTKEDIKRVADKYLDLNAYAEVIIQPD